MQLKEAYDTDIIQMIRIGDLRKKNALEKNVNYFPY